MRAEAPVGGVGTFAPRGANVARRRAAVRPRRLAGGDLCRGRPATAWRFLGAQDHVRVTEGGRSPPSDRIHACGSRRSHSQWPSSSPARAGASKTCRTRRPRRAHRSARLTARRVKSAFRQGRARTTPPRRTPVSSSQAHAPAIRTASAWALRCAGPATSAGTTRSPATRCLSAGREPPGREVA